MSDKALRDKIIRLAHAQPKLRKDLLPLLKTAAQYTPQLDDSFGSPKGLAKLMGATLILRNQDVPRKLADKHPYLNALMVNKDSYELIIVSSGGPVFVYGWDIGGGVNLQKQPDWTDSGMVVYTGDKKIDWRALRRII